MRISWDDMDWDVPSKNGYMWHYITTQRIHKATGFSPDHTTEKKIDHISVTKNSEDP